MTFVRERDLGRVGITNADFISYYASRLCKLAARLFTGVALFTVGVLAQGPPAPQPPSETASTATADLYRRLANLPLDPNAVYKIRDASIDREDVHLSLNDGTIAFTRAVNGQITGAIFSGEGEILIVPPDFTERHSLSMFTRIAALSERFSLAYLRFHDPKLITDLAPFLRPAEDPQGFLTTNSALALSLSESDALRAFIALTHDPSAKDSVGNSRFLFARVSGQRLGTFDVVFDPMLTESISVSQAAYTDRGRFYDLWMSFPMRSRRQKPLRDSLDQRILDINSYKIRADVRPPTDLSAETTLTAKVLQSGARTVPFELSRYLKLSSVEWQQSAQTSIKLDHIQNEAIAGSELARSGNDIVAVVFPQPLQAGQNVVLKFTYSGSVMSDAGGGLLFVGARGTWYPNRGPAMSNFDTEFRYPAAWRLLATGKLAKEETQNEVISSRWVSERPLPVAGFNLGKYLATSTTVENTRVDIYSTRSVETDFAAKASPQPPDFRPGIRRAPPRSVLSQLDPSQKAQYVLDNAADTIAYLAPRIGPFPYSTLSLTQIPGPNSQGWPGLIFLSSYVFLTSEERMRSRLGGLEVFDPIFDHVMTGHETAHQWWGDNVLWTSYRDQWLMEALANYLVFMRLEANDPDLMQELMDQYRSDLLEKTPGSDKPVYEAGPVSLGARLNSSKFSGAYVPVAYGRGTWLLHMLRHMLRDSALPSRRVPQRRTPGAPATAVRPTDSDATFFAILKEVQAGYSGRQLSTREFLTAFERAIPASHSFEGRKSLDWFFDGWINGTAIPVLKLEKVRFSGVGGKTTATAIVTQTDAPELMITSVPIYAVVTEGPPIFVGRVFADGETTEIKIAVPVGTKSLLLDPYSTVLRKP